MIKLLLLVSLSNMSAAQVPTYLPQKVGVWHNFTIGCSGSAQGLTTQENRVYTGKLVRLSEAIHHSQVFDPPLGIEAVPDGCVNATIEFLDDYPEAHKGPYPGYLMVGTFSYALYRGTQKVVVADEGPHFFVDVNSMVRVYNGMPKMAEDEGGKIFIAPEIAKTISGFPLYRNGTIVITRIQRPIFQPVSAERYIRARIWQAQKELADFQRRHQDFIGQKHQESVQKTYERMRARNTQQAESYLRSVQDGDRIGDRNFTKSEQAKESEIGTYEAELESLSQVQRAAQAYVVRNYPGPPRLRLLAVAGEQGAEPLVCFNPEFFDRSRPRTDFQSLVVGRLYENGLKEKSYDPQYQRVIDFRRTFDFQTLLPILDGQ